MNWGCAKYLWLNPDCTSCIKINPIGIGVACHFQVASHFQTSQQNSEDRTQKTHSSSLRRDDLQEDSPKDADVKDLKESDQGQEWIQLKPLQLETSCF